MERVMLAGCLALGALACAPMSDPSGYGYGGSSYGTGSSYGGSSSGYGSSGGSSSGYGSGGGGGGSGYGGSSWTGGSRAPYYETRSTWNSDDNYV